MLKLCLVLLFFKYTTQSPIYLNGLENIVSEEESEVGELNNNYYFGNYSWYTKNLTWCLLTKNLEQINLENFEDLIQQSFDKWAVSNITFTRITSFNLAHVKISLEQLNHGDWMPFHNLTKKNIHAFSPMHRILAGRIHVNFNNNWNKNNFINEMTFNIGTVLGMMMNLNPNSLMFGKRYLSNATSATDFDLQNINLLFKNPHSPYIIQKNYFDPMINQDLIYKPRLLNFYNPQINNQTNDVYLNSPVFIINF